MSDIIVIQKELLKAEAFRTLNGQTKLKKDDRKISDIVYIALIVSTPLTIPTDTNMV